MVFTAHNRTVYASAQERLGVRPARSVALLLPVPPLTHIPARRAAAQRLLGGRERRKQPHVRRHLVEIF
jgi:hypothetical protein